MLALIPFIGPLTVTPAGLLFILAAIFKFIQIKDTPILLALLPLGLGILF